MVDWRNRGLKFYYINIFKDNFTWKNMAFIGGYKSCWERPPGRIYLHDTARETLENGPIKKPYKAFRRAFQAGMPLLHEELGHSNFFLSILWGKKDELRMDFFAYTLDDVFNWQSNVGVSPWVVERGVIWKRPDGEMTCGEGIILLGEEEKLRRRTHNLAEYLESGPLPIEQLNAALKFAD